MRESAEDGPHKEERTGEAYGWCEFTSPAQGLSPARATTSAPWSIINRVALCQATLSIGLYLLLEGLVPTVKMYPMAPDINPRSGCVFTWRAIAAAEVAPPPAAPPARPC